MGRVQAELQANQDDGQAGEYDDIHVSSSHLNGPINYHNVILPTSSEHKMGGQRDHQRQLQVSNHIGKPLVPPPATVTTSSTSRQQQQQQQVVGGSARVAVTDYNTATTTTPSSTTTTITTQQSSASQPTTWAPPRRTTGSPRQRDRQSQNSYSQSKLNKPPRVQSYYDDVQRLKYSRGSGVGGSGSERPTNQTQISIVAPSNVRSRAASVSRKLANAGPSVTSGGGEHELFGDNDSSTCRWRSLAEFKRISLANGELIVRDSYEQPCYILTLRGFLRWQGNDFIPLNNFKVHLHAIDIMPDDDDYDEDATATRAAENHGTYNGKSGGGATAAVDGSGGGDKSYYNNEDLDGGLDLESPGKTFGINIKRHPQRRGRPVPLKTANCSANLMANNDSAQTSGSSSTPMQTMPLHWIDRSFRDEIIILVDCGFLVLRTEGDGSRLNLVSISFYQNGDSSTRPTFKKLSRAGPSSMANSEHLVFSTDNTTATTGSTNKDPEYSTNQQQPLISMPISSRYLCQNRIVLTATNQVQLVLDRFELQRLSLPPIRQVIVADGRSYDSSIRIPILHRTHSKQTATSAPVTATEIDEANTTTAGSRSVGLRRRQSRDVTMARKSSAASLIPDSGKCLPVSKPGTLGLHEISLCLHVEIPKASWSDAAFNPFALSLGNLSSSKLNYRVVERHHLVSTRSFW